MLYLLSEVDNQIIILHKMPVIIEFIGTFFPL
jgi:hypothetical protein